MVADGELGKFKLTENDWAVLHLLVELLEVISC